MIIEIRKAGFVNKGAELMLHAVVQQLRSRYPEAKLTMPPLMGGAPDTFEKMQALNLYPKAWLLRKGIQFGQLGKLAPTKLRRAYGIILDEEVDVVVDAAGFSYSDQWGIGSSRELARSSDNWKKKGTKLILLPQALGPYKKNSIDKYVRRWVDNADLIFPRESDSYSYVTEVVGEQDKIKMYPDFTNLVEGTLPLGYDSSDKRVAIVPNYRMVDKTNGNESEAYLPFLIRVAKYLVKKGAKPFLLVHEGANDQMLAEQVSEAVGGIPIVKETDPLHIKGILGTCDFTVGSRFHGLVSALSQGVPSLATGWSHKYKRLFEDYGFGEGLVSVTDSDEALHGKLEVLINPDSASKLRIQLNRQSEELKGLSRDMWVKVFAVIDEAVAGKQ